MSDDSLLNRRDFVKTSAAVAAGGLALGALARGAFARAKAFNAGEQIKVALIGCGGRGCGAALDAISADPGAVIWAAADLFPDRLQHGLSVINSEVKNRVEAGTLSKQALDQVQVDAARQFTGFDGYQQAIASCDAVILATSPHFRPTHLRAAVEAGKHVFCEKPVAVDAPGVRSVLATVKMAQDKNLSLVSGFCWRYAARERDTYQQVHAGAIGDIRAVYTTYNAGGWVKPVERKPQWSEMEYQLRCWHYFTWLSGDHITEQACHAIDKMAWAMNDVPPTKCTAVGGRQCRDQMGEPGCVFDHFAVTFEYASGARGFHMCRHFPNSSADNSDTIMGSKGVCRVDGWADLHEITGETNWKCQTQKNDMYRAEHDAFFASIRSGKPINDGVRMADSPMISVMARMAAYTAQTLTWDQALNSTEEMKPDRYALDATPPKCELPRPGLTKFV